MVLQKQQELEVHLQTADEVCRLGQEDSVLLIDALEREDKLRVSSCHIKCGGGGGKGSFQGDRNIFIAFVHGEKGRGKGGLL